MYCISFDVFDFLFSFLESPVSVQLRPISVSLSILPLSPYPRYNRTEYVLSGIECSLRFNQGQFAI